MVTSKQLPNGSVVIRPRKSIGGAGITAIMIIIITALIALAGIGIFAPARLATAQEYSLSLLHGGIGEVAEETYVDGCVSVPGADALQAVTRTRRMVSYRDGTTLEVVFSGRPAPTNACP